MQEYTTVAGVAEAEFVEKRSRFLSVIAPVTSEEQAAAFLSERKTRYWDANHNCSAFVLRAGCIQRYSDDGEPQGTAGVPMLEVLKREEVVDALVVVTRYFGGTLLGAGGLVRAYTHGAKLALDAATRLHMRECAVFSLCVPYALYGKLENLMAASGVEVLGSDFAAEVTVQGRLARNALPAFQKQLSELSAGNVQATVEREEFAPMRAE